MLAINLAAEAVLSQRFEPVDERELMQPDTALVVHGLVDDPGVLQRASEWILSNAAPHDNASRVILPENLANCDSPDVKRILTLQRKLTVALVDWVPVRYSAQANNVAPNGRYGWHEDGRHNMTLATITDGESEFRVKQRGMVDRIAVAPDVTVVMLNDTKGVKHSTLNMSGAPRQTVVQHSYRYPRKSTTDTKY